MARPTVLGVAGVTGTLGLLILLRYSVDGDGPLGGASLWTLVVVGALGLAGYGLFAPRRADLTRFEPAVLGAPGDFHWVLWASSVASTVAGTLGVAWVLLQLTPLVGPAAYLFAAASLSAGAAVLYLLVRFKHRIVAWA